MGDYKVYPAKLNGDIKIPPSKSMAHRAVICASLSGGISRLTNIDYSDDIIATVNAMRALGDEPENEAFLLAYKTRKKKVQEARILSLAQIGSQEAIKEVKKYCFKDSDLFTTVF